MTILGFTHHFIASQNAHSSVLLLLHGTGGSETDLIPLGQSLLGDAALLSVRGKVLENGMPRFFRRLAEGVFDEEDLKFRTHELAEFIEAARAHYGLGKRKLVAVGYSNGANIASSLLLLHPHLLSGAVLFRPMVPFKADFLPDLSRVSVLLSAGQRDPIVPSANAQRLGDLLTACGAQVSLHWYSGGHELSPTDLTVAKAWLVENRFDPSNQQAVTEPA